MISINFVEPIRDINKIEDMKRVLRSDSERNYMLFLFAIHLPFRISDILLLKVKDVAGGYVSIKEKKTKKNNRFIISTSIKKELETYIFDMDDEEFLFQSRQGYNKPLSRGQAFNIIRNASKRAGVRAVIAPHSMRKTFGWHFYKKTKDVVLLQEIYGHSSESITLRYIGINQETKENAMKNFKL